MCVSGILHGGRAGERCRSTGWLAVPYLRLDWQMSEEGAFDFARMSRLPSVRSFNLCYRLNRMAVGSTAVPSSATWFTHQSDRMASVSGLSSVGPQLPRSIRVPIGSIRHCDRSSVCSHESESSAGHALDRVVNRPRSAEPSDRLGRCFASLHGKLHLHFTGLTRSHHTPQGPHNRRHLSLFDGIVGSASRIASLPLSSRRAASEFFATLLKRTP
jgi:hypothetical protein